MYKLHLNLLSSGEEQAVTGERSGQIPDSQPHGKYLAVLSVISYLSTVQKFSAITFCEHMF